MNAGAIQTTILVVVAMAAVAAPLAQAVPLLTHESSVVLPREADRGTLAVSVTIGPDGGICITDATTHSVHLIDRRGIHAFGTGEFAGLANPMDSAVESAGGFVCTDSRPEGGRTIRRLDFFGQAIAYNPAPPVDLWQPERLLVTRDGNFVTADPSNGLIAKHDAATGALLWTQPLGGTVSGELIAIGRPAEAPDGRIYLPLPGDRRIAILSADGVREATFGSSGSARGRLSFPVGVAFSPDGTVLVLDRMRHVILFYDQGHDFVSEFGSFGMGPADLYHPSSIAATADGRIYITQAFELPVQQFRFVLTESRSSTSEMFFSRVPEAWSGSAVPIEEGEEVSVASQRVSPVRLSLVSFGWFPEGPSGSDKMEAM